MEELMKQLGSVKTALEQSNDIRSLKSALGKTLGVIEQLSAELLRLRCDHDELDEYISDIDEELDDIEDELDALNGWDSDEDWDGEDLDPDEEDEEKDDESPTNITPLNPWNKDRE